MLAYFLQVNVCWLLFYGVYYALLSKETFFRLNRIWLIISLLCGLALPFVADYFAVKVAPTVVFAMTLEPFVVTAKALQQNLVADTEGVLLKIVATVYGLGCAVLTTRFLGGLFIIFNILKKAKIEQQAGSILVFTEGGVPPFSFFNFIFINPKEFESYDFQQIMQHEQAHVQQKHSFDVVFLELINIVFWCSPLVYLYKTSLRNVHEYLADEAVLRTSATPQYGRLLLKQRQSRVALSLTSNISNHFFSQLKKRILMMTRNKSKRTALIKYALAAPIFLILTAALASPKTPILANAEALSEKAVKAIDDKLVDNQQVKSFTTPKTFQNPSPLYSTASDTTFKPLVDLKNADLNQVDKLNIEATDEENTRVTVILKNGSIEYYKGKRADMGKFNRITNATLKVDGETTNQQAQKLDEMVVVGHNLPKRNSEQPTQKLEDEQKTLKQQKDKLDAEKASTDPIFTIVEENPEFIGGNALLFRWLGQNIKYPVIARQAGGQGTVYVGFVVEKDGSITNVTIKRDVPVIVRDTVTIMEVNGMKGNKIVEKTDYSLGKEAVRVISAMPNWKPGKQKGVPVRVGYTLPIKFKLE